MSETRAATECVHVHQICAPLIYDRQYNMLMCTFSAFRVSKRQYLAHQRVQRQYMK